MVNVSLLGMSVVPGIHTPFIIFLAEAGLVASLTPSGEDIVI